MALLFNFLRNRFRDTDEYNREMLLRDLRDLADELDRGYSRQGTWKPDLQFNNLTTGITYSRQYGYYERLGNAVAIQADLILTSKGTATGVAEIDNFPFLIAPGTPAAGQDGYGAPSLHAGYCTGLTLTSGYRPVLVVSSGIARSFIQLYQTNNVTGAQLTDTAFAATTRYTFSGIYFTSDD